MTTTPACACGAPSPTAVLCKACTARLGRDLALAADLAPDLDAAVARLTVRGGGGRRTSDVQPLPYDPDASEAAAQLRIALAGWTRVMQETHAGKGWAWPAGTVPAMARWLAARLDAVRQHEAAQDVADEVREAVNGVERVLSRKPGRLYGGPCPSCGTDLTGRPGAASVTCQACGERSDIGERWGAMREAMRDMLGSAQWCVTAASALGTHVTDRAVYMWAKRSQLVPKGTRPSRTGGKPVSLYRLGDVLELADEGPRGARMKSKVPATAGTAPGRGQPD